ncbi:hypothetical protein PSV09DRAFT_2373231 [Bipolaris maydis]|nr:hypothetical protein J3E74DRAFT_429239 [Bipolaris maydis]KAJ6209718.1 hypothetical protein PSV09DRAFT_2373231 [Bipolaris maydis]
MSSLATSQPSQFQDQLEAILDKLKTDPSSITADDARLLSDNFTTRVHHQESSHTQTHRRSLLTAAKDLHGAVDDSPEEVTTEVLRTTQSIVSKMQKALGNTNVLHPEVEDELQEEIARIEPKIAQGTVTKAEANRLHSLEARAHGHTEKGGITAAAQSVVARRERQLSPSGGPEALQPSDKQPYHSKEENLRQVELPIRLKIQDGTVMAAEANKLHSCEMRAHGHTEKGGLAATAQSVVARQQKTLSDTSNSPYPSETDTESRKEDINVGKEPKKVEGDLGDVLKTENEAQ